MKKLVLAFAMICAAMLGRAQSFEGVIHWKMNLEITDPKVKAQMEEAKKKADDPANQAKMKELQAKLDDPKMKAMMDQNPQMKAQMEAALKAMAGGGGMSAMMPTGVVVKLKGANTLTTVEGGMMDKTQILHVADKDMTYTINSASKTYMVMNSSKSNVPPRTPKITKTTETQKILGYTCTKYLIEQSGLDGKSLNTNYWATNEIKGVDLKGLAKQQASQGQSLVFTEIDGLPLKVETITPQGNMIMECTEFKKETLPASTFALPSGYTEQKF